MRYLELVFKSRRNRLWEDGFFDMVTRPVLCWIQNLELFGEIDSLQGALGFCYCSCICWRSRVSSLRWGRTSYRDFLGLLVLDTPIGPLMVKWGGQCHSALVFFDISKRENLAWGITACLSLSASGVSVSVKFYLGGREVSYYKFV